MSLPFDIQQELDAAVLRTGWTTALINAEREIKDLLAMGPHTVELYMAKLYKELP